MSAVEVICSGKDVGPIVAVFGCPSTGDSMPKSPDVRRLIGDFRKIFPAPGADGRTTMPSTAGCEASGTRL